MSTKETIRTGSATHPAFWVDDNGQRYAYREDYLDAWAEQNTFVAGCQTREEAAAVAGLFDFDID